ncbi:outer membrane protein assembly factor BamB family protein [Pararhodonellum marinum]|uniref:outer membrane protein assembly factor BamB family protein n=1 Tax=Pararhodonellum marinum TaxID=2755358 RepID=UPI00188E20E5|nr:PQQ-binding-like beta-propeller repeat protein [Pararhodonellum marinum]
MKKSVWTLFVGFFVAPCLFAQENLWEFDTHAPIHASPTLEREYLFIGNKAGTFYSLNTNSGKANWQFQSKSPILAKAAIWNDLVLFGNENGQLTALKKDNGKLEWIFQAGEEHSLDLWDYFRSGPLPGNDKIFWASGDGHVYALHPKTGEVIWKFDSGAAIHMTPVLEDGKLLVGNFKGQVYALEPETGDLIWKFQAIGSRYFPDAEFQKSPWVKDGKVYIGSRDLNLYVLDLETGRGIWHFTEQGGSWIIASPLIHDGAVYFGSSDTYRFYALDDKTGKEKWSIRTFTRSYGSPIAFKDWIIFPGFDGKIRAVSPESGTLEWEYQTLTSIENYPKLYNEAGKFRTDLQINSAEEAETLIDSLGPIINTPVLNNETLYFGSLDGKVYAVDLGGIK